MKQWGLFLISLGSFMLMMSGANGYKFGVMITGGVLALVGAYLVWGKKEK